MNNKINLKSFIHNIADKSTSIYLLLHFFILKFSNKFVAFSLENCLKFVTFKRKIRQIICALISLQYVKSSIYNMTDKSPNTFNKTKLPIKPLATSTSIQRPYNVVMSY